MTVSKTLGLAAVSAALLGATWALNRQNDNPELAVYGAAVGTFKVLERCDIQPPLMQHPLFESALGHLAQPWLSATKASNTDTSKVCAAMLKATLAGPHYDENHMPETHISKEYVEALTFVDTVMTVDIADAVKQDNDIAREVGDLMGLSPSEAVDYFEGLKKVALTPYLDTDEIPMAPIEPIELKSI